MQHLGANCQVFKKFLQGKFTSWLMFNFIFVSFQCVHKPIRISLAYFSAVSSSSSLPYQFIRLDQNRNYKILKYKLLQAASQPASQLPIETRQKRKYHSVDLDVQ